METEKSESIPGQWWKYCKMMHPTTTRKPKSLSPFSKVITGSLRLLIVSA